MAGALDMARHTALLRKQQRERNLEAIKETEARRAELDRVAKMSPTELRRQQVKARKIQQAGVAAHRVGELEERMLGAGSIDDKMDRRGHENKGQDDDLLDDDSILDDDDLLDDGDEEWDGLDEEEDGWDEDEIVEDEDENDGDEEAPTYASPQAEALKKKLKLTDAQVLEFEASSHQGYTKNDIQAIKDTIGG